MTAPDRPGSVYDLMATCSRCGSTVKASVIAPAPLDAINRLLADLSAQGWYFSVREWTPAAIVRHSRYEDRDEDLCPACTAENHADP